MALERSEIRGWEVLSLASEDVRLELVPALGGTVTSLRALRQAQGAEERAQGAEGRAQGAEEQAQGAEDQAQGAEGQAQGAEVLARTPWGLPFVGARALPGSAEAEMLDTSPGGWEPLFPNAGQSVNAHGAEQGFDGEARLTWLEWRADDTSVTLTGRLRRSPFELRRVLAVQGPEVSLTETVHNVGAEPVEVMWGSRVLLGGDLLGAGSTLDTAASLVRPDPRVSGASSYEDLLPWPRAYASDGVVNLRGVPGPGAGITRLAYLCELARPWARVTRPATGLALELEWDGEAWPYLWYALEAGGRAGYPWYGAGYHLGLTPASSWPSSGLHDARRSSGTTVWVEPGTSRTATLTLRVLAGS